MWFRGSYQTNRIVWIQEPFGNKSATECFISLRRDSSGMFEGIRVPCVSHHRDTSRTRVGRWIKDTSAGARRQIRLHLRRRWGSRALRSDSRCGTESSVPDFLRWVTPAGHSPVTIAVDAAWPVLCSWSQPVRNSSCVHSTILSRWFLIVVGYPVDSSKNSFLKNEEIQS